MNTKHLDKVKATDSKTLDTGECASPLSKTRRDILNSKTEERNSSCRKFVPPPDMDSDPIEREELMMQADMLNGLTPQQFTQIMASLCQVS